MKTINDDAEGFFDQGGWSFLHPESDVSGPVVLLNRTLFDCDENCGLVVRVAVLYIICLL